MADMARVEVRTAWLSKINWTQVIGALAIILAWFGIDMPPEVRAAVVTGIGAATQIVTWVLRTWFNGTVSPGSIGQ